MRLSQVSMLHEYLERSAGRAPDKTALVFRDMRASWGEMRDAAGRVARALKERGLTRGARVVLYLNNSAELCAAIFGVLAADGVFCVVNPQTKKDKLSYILNDCRAQILVTERSLESQYGSVLADSHLTHAFVVGQGDDARVGKVCCSDFASTMSGQSPTWPKARNIPTDLAAILYTSGSTGDPKGVMLTHQNMVAATESITTYLDNRFEDVVLNVLPMSFDYGLYQWLMATQFTGTMVLEQSFNYPAAILKRIDEEGVSGLPLVPTIASVLRKWRDKGVKFPGVRYVTNTAAALSDTHIETARDLCPNAKVFSMYGLTECKRVSYLPPELLAEKPTSVGIAMPNMEVKILRPDGTECEAGEVGELVVRGPQVMRGYWEKPEVTAKWLKPSPDIPNEMWLYTGDQFKRDEDGHLYFIGRGDSIIKSRGEKVAPREVENVLYTLEGVEDALVVGEDDEQLGQAIRAFITVRGDRTVTSQGAIRHCAKHLEGYMVPRRVTVLSSLPKTTTGKLTTKNIWEHAAKTRVGGDDV